MKLLKLPVKKVNEERLRLILDSFSKSKNAADEWGAIDEILVALQDHVNTLDSEYSDFTDVKIVELRALIEKIYEPYCES